MPESQQRRWHLYPDPEALAAQASRWILSAARGALEERGIFRLVLAGGRTPAAVYARLAEAPADWHRWEIRFGDERCLPRGHPERNDTMAREAWFSRLPGRGPALHPIPAELGPEAGARRYQQELAGLGDFDLVLLGLGEDGHTASLFPGHRSPARGDALAVCDAPKPPPARVSLGAGRLARARAVLFLVTGAGKRPALARWAAGDATLPAAWIRPAGGVDILADAEAGRGLTPFPDLPGP